jgi:hypothetical protein
MPYNDYVEKDDQLILGTFNTAGFNCISYVESNGMTTLNDKLEMIWKEAIMVYFMILS